MRIAMVAPVTHPFPPTGYGPWERVAFNLTEALVAQGHHVTVFAAEGSTTTAELHPTLPGSLSQTGLDGRLAEEEHLAIAFAAIAGGGFDIVHSHLHVHALPYTEFLASPLISTLHGVAWNPATHRLLRRYAHQPFVSISDAERRFLPSLRYEATVYNGLRVDEFPPGPGGEHVVCVGRIAPEKGIDLAIATAHQAGRQLRIAGPIEAQHQSYFETQVRPHLVGRDIEYVGELTGTEIAAFVGEAAALLMPLRWDEPFGLVVVESLAVGTPVIAWRRGAMPELLDEGRTGHLVADVEGAVAAIARVGLISRSECRRTASARFSAASMANGYADVYAAEAVRSSPR